jgi:hypothetical protein
VLADPEASPREKVAASIALVGAAKVNLDAVRTAVLVKRFRPEDERFAAARAAGESLRSLVEKLRASENGPADADVEGHGA